MRHRIHSAAQPKASIVSPAARRRRARRQRGQGLAEYALLLALVAAIAIGGLTFLGGSIDGVLSSVGNAFGPPGASQSAAPTHAAATPNPDQDAQAQGGQDAQADQATQDAQADQGTQDAQAEAVARPAALISAAPV